MTRQGLTSRDNVRTLVFGNADYSYAAADETAVSIETQLVREFQHKGGADSYSFPMTYDVMIRPYNEGDVPGVLRADGQDRANESDQPIILDANERLRVEVRRPEQPASPPPPVWQSGTCRRRTRSSASMGRTDSGNRPQSL